MSEVALHDPFFEIREVPGLTEADIVALLAGRLAGVHVRSMINGDDCATLVRSLDELPLDTYDERRVKPPIARFGPAINDYRFNGGLSEEYWLHAERAKDDWSRAALQPDPFRHALDHLTQAWPSPVAPAKRGERDLFAGIVREINNGAHVHYDDLLREFPADILDSPIVAQLAFNLYLSVPETGGETVVWRRRWQPSDELSKLGYGYAYDLVEPYECVEVKPNVGDGLLLDPRNLHAVKKGTGERRVAIAFFLGLTHRGELVAWS